MQRLWALVSGTDALDAEPSRPRDDVGESDSGSVVIHPSASLDSKHSTQAYTTDAVNEEYLEFQKDIKQLDRFVVVLQRFAGGGFAAVSAGDAADARSHALSEALSSSVEGGSSGSVSPEESTPDEDQTSRMRVLVQSTVGEAESDSSSCASEVADISFERNGGVNLRSISRTKPVDAVELSDHGEPDVGAERGLNGSLDDVKVLTDEEAGIVEKSALQTEADSKRAPISIAPGQCVVSAFTGLAEVMVRGDRVNHALWDRFMEHSTMKLIVECLERTSASGETDSAVPPSSPSADVSRALPNGKPMVSILDHVVDSETRKNTVRVQAQVLRTLSILVHSVNRRSSLYCLFASNHINRLLSFRFDFTDDEVLLYFMSAVKTIGLCLDESLVQLFFDAQAGTFPLYTATTRFFAHPDGMVRIAVRNVTLTIFTLKNPTVTDFTIRDPTGYLTATVDRLGRLCGDIARAFEFLLDDGREHRRTVSRRTLGRKRQKIRLPQLQAQLAEIDNVIEYLNDVVATDDSLLCDCVTNLLATRFFGPFFRPIASQASPDAVQLSKERWSFRRSNSQKSDLNCEPAISALDAAARSIVLSYLINLVTTQQLGDVILSEITKPSSRFQMRTALHGLRAMASDLTAKERTTFIAFTTLETIIRWDCVSAERLAAHGLTFELAGEDNDDGDEMGFRRTTSAEEAELFSRLPSAVGTFESGENESSASSVSNGMLLSLSEFKAPLTPTGALTPTNAVDLDEPDAPHSPSYPLLPDAVDDEGILALFGRGEASLREIVSAIILVVRTHEVRTVRVTQTVARIISGVGLHANNWRLSLDVAKIALDELASNMTDFLACSSTTIVAIEAAFENFRAASLETSEACGPVPELWTLLQMDRVTNFAAELPSGANRRRRSVTASGSISPVEWEDAAAFFILLRAYERIVTEVIIERGGHSEPSVPKNRSLYTMVANVLQDKDSAGTYIDKKEALARVAHHTLKRSWRVASP